MQITKAEAYGIFGVIYLARQTDDRAVPLAEIAAAQDVPEKFLAKIFQNLTKTGIVRSHRGVRGGFTLTGDPSQLPIRTVIEAIQGPYHLIQCLADQCSCDKADYCSVREVIQRAERKLLEVFDKYTVADLIRWEKEHKAPAAD